MQTEQDSSRLTRVFASVTPGTGITLGLAIGVALGIAFDELAVGIGCGIAIGAGIDAMAHTRKRDGVVQEKTKKA